MFLNVNGITLFYQQSGQGQPIILLHGNGESHTIFDVLTNQLSTHFTVYAIDSRDHGQSSKVKDLDYISMMEDVAEFIQKLHLDKPILYGFSDGGIIGLLLASRYPDMLSKLIISGANLSPKGVTLLCNIQTLIQYLKTKDHKIKMMLHQPNIDVSEIEKISVPTLVLAGSKDLIKQSHTKYIAEHIPNSTLRIIDNEDHFSYIIHSEKLYGIIKPFIEDHK